MKIINLTLLTISVLLFFSPILSAKDKVIGHMEPFSEELLPAPINLKQKCEDVAIREWRSSENRSYTEPTRRAVKMMSEACNMAVEGFQPYVKWKGYTPASHQKFSFNLSLIPFNAYDDGANYRGLNDIFYRFAKRYKSLDDAGNVSHILGYTSRAGDDYIYLRNDPLTPDWKINSQFKVVFVHELYHAMSYRYGIWQQLAGDGQEKSEKEEEMAYGFTEYLGLGR